MPSFGETARPSDDSIRKPEPRRAAILARELNDPTIAAKAMEQMGPGDRANFFVAAAPSTDRATRIAEQLKLGQLTALARRVGDVPYHDILSEVEKQKQVEHAQHREKVSPA